MTYPTVTRWNSLHDCSLQLLKVFNASLEAGSEFANNNLNKLLEVTATKKSTFTTFSRAEIDYLVSYTTLMDPIAKGLDYLQGDQHSFYGQLLPTLTTICLKLQRLSNSPALGTMKSIIPKVLQRFQERFESHLNFEESSRDAIVAAVSNPKYKLRWITNETFKGKAKQMFMEEIRKLENSEAAAEGNRERENDQEGEDFLIFSSPSNEDGGSASGEAKNYLESSSTSMEMLEAFPLVKKLFIRFNTPLNSSGAIERVFNYAGILSNPKRGSMLPSNFSSCMFIKGNQSFAAANAKVYNPE